MRRLKSIFTFFSCLVISLILGCDDVDIDEGQLKQLVFSGNEIVNALENYKDSKNSLPNTLDQLVALGYLQSIPDTGIDGRQFRYVRFNPLEDMEYRISVGLSKPSIVSDKIVELTFRSDGKYIASSVEVHRSLDQWVIQTTYR